MKQNVSQGLGYGHHGLYVRPESAQPITSIFRLMDLKHSYMCTQFKYVASQISLDDEHREQQRYCSRYDMELIGSLSQCIKLGPMHVVLKVAAMQWQKQRNYNNGRVL